MEQCLSLSTGFCTIFLQIRPLCWPHSWLRHSCGQHSGLICKKIVRKPVESDAHCSKKLLQCSNVTVSVVKYHFSYRRSWQQLCSHGRHSGGAEGAQAPPKKNLEEGSQKCPWRGAQAPPKFSIEEIAQKSDHYLKFF